MNYNLNFRIENEAAACGECGCRLRQRTAHAQLRYKSYVRKTQEDWSQE